MWLEIFPKDLLTIMDPTSELTGLDMSSEVSLSRAIQLALSWEEVNC